MNGVPPERRYEVASPEMHLVQAHCELTIRRLAMTF
jgi:hypothetical protein